MKIEEKFEDLAESEQNRLLRKIADQVRPMLGEIGEVLVTPRPDGRKPGFVGLMFRHQSDNVILMAEYIDQSVRLENRNRAREAPKHVFSQTQDPYIAALIGAGSQLTIRAADSLPLVDLADYVKKAFHGFYKNEIEDRAFRIKLQAMALCIPTGGSAQSLLYFASKQDEEFLLEAKTATALGKLVEQLIRNALGLAAISDQELRSAVAYLGARLPESFDDYVLPQTLAAIYAYVREVVPLALYDTTLPEIESEDTALKEPLQSIHSASNIRVNRAIGGSLKGASVYSLEITTRAKDGDSRTSYHAIAKFSTISEARDEADGLRKMQRYFSRIGKMLPPPLAVYLVRDNTGKPQISADNWLRTPCISVTPDLEGKVLSEKITEQWHLPTRRVTQFSGYLAQAKQFVNEIQGQQFEEVTPTKPTRENEVPADRVIQFFSAFRKDMDRYALLGEALKVPRTAFLTVKCRDLGSCRLANPAVWLKQMLDDPSKVKWRTHPKRIRQTVLAHGDFHAGNLFYSADGEHLTVLDYDRVTGAHPEDDFARLEASFVACVFALGDFNRHDTWEKYAPPALSLLAGCHPASVEEFEKSAFARDLFEVLAIIRSGSCPYYAASVVKALLIQLKTTCTKWNGTSYQLAEQMDLAASQGRNAATWLYLALMLGRLVELEGAVEEWQDPYKAALLNVALGAPRR